MSGQKTARWNAVIRTGYPGYLHYLFLFLFIAIIIIPLAPLLINTALFIINEPVPSASFIVPSGRVLGLLVNSVFLAITVTISATAIGVLAGTWLWNNARAMGGYLPWALLVFIPVPSTLYYFSWSYLFPLTGWFSAWGVQVMMYLPLLTLFSFIGLRLVESEKIEAGRVSAPDITVYRRIVLPMAAPLILAGSGLVFIFSMLDYTVPSLCSINVYSLEIFAQYSADHQAAHAFLLALPLVIIAGAGVYFSQYHMKRAFQNVAWERAFHPSGFRLPSWLFRLTQGAIFITIAGTVYVLVLLLGSAIT
ncbi:MAG: hypothetical protein MUF37_01055, partial [Methanoregulaceae archaeon]|nr:hypothetical protein [Methanoregulaceae archaeon]